MAEILFWISMGLVCYTYIGYPCIIGIFGYVFGRRVHSRAITPSISIIIAVYNEETVLGKKIDSLLNVDYPSDKREILIGSDGSIDKTDDIIRSYAAAGIRYVRSDQRRGKPAMLNTLVPQAQGEIIVFTDGRQLFDAGALRALAGNFADETAGCVSGELILTRSADNTGVEGVGLYWTYEKFIREQESAFDSMLGATGAIYAIRKKLFTPLPEDMLIDDMVIPLKIVAQGYRAIFDRTAKAFDTLARDMAQETPRKIRTLAGNWQLFVRAPGWLNPFTSRIAVQLISHKLLRVIAPYALVLMYGASVVLADTYFFRVLLLLQTILYVCAGIGYIIPAARHVRIINLPYIFCDMHIAAVRGLYWYIVGKQSVQWK